MNVSLSPVEGLLHRNTMKPTTKPFDVPSVLTETVPVEQPKADISIGIGLPRAGTETKTNREDTYEKLLAIPEFAHLGPIFKSSLAAYFTDHEVEYVFDINNALNNQLLEKVTVQMDGSGESFEVVNYIPCPIIKCNDTGTTYALVKLPDDNISYIEITVSDHAQKVLKPNWSASCDEIEVENELEDIYTLPIPTVEKCVKKIISYMGMLASDVYRGEHDVLVRAKMALGRTSADPGA
ncbi:unnamed protein product [Rotaria socialis]|uniref:Coatomer gamma subunit appendage Ig-like subdomain domain-containing protein n=1 Tax=Rotaria socialis TaxID=392032 RepID=A0A821CZD1_9BILA|nr:unnamed protein product [Rotaria socialis]CAF4277539.1 unnamed protein product [Rotaria socialis]CAF4325916.1 unnamed protein product [Rotaria socialis]CAF4457555.1 unnamed protein product [Rotaria socialis]CAF4613786.1 unnamed protein product [Rotaria socialis]